MLNGGAAQPVYIISNSDLRENGGQFSIAGATAVPVLNPSSSQLISNEASNQLEIGSDGKLYVPPSGGGLPYRVYTALVTQEFDGAPSAIVLQNTLGVELTWGRLGVGQYYALTPEEPGAGWDANKAATFLGENRWISIPPEGDPVIFVTDLSTTGQGYIGIRTYTTVGVITEVDNILRKCTLEIRVYP